MPESRLTKTLAVIAKKMKWTNNKNIGYKTPERRDVYMNPLISPPPRSPSSVEDFRHPERLGHWRSLGFNYTSQLTDRYKAHEAVFFFMLGMITSVWVWCYSPDFKYGEWARREAYLRTTKREALGLPLIDRDVVDPARVVLPTEEEIGDFPIMG